MTINLATKADRETLIEAYLEMLRELEPFGFDIPATRQAAEHNTDAIFLPAAERGEGVLIARDPEGRWLGAVFWVITPTPCADVVAFGHGTVVRDDARRTGVGRALREAALARLTRAGVTRIVGAAQEGNTPGHGSLLAMGMKPTTTIYEMRL
jgi:GNAT superfamily N-acetyltransferase